MKRPKVVAVGVVAVGAVVTGVYVVAESVSVPKPVTYAVVKWVTKSNGIVVTNVKSVVSYSTNLITWERIATNSTGQVTVATDATNNFFRVNKL